MSFQLRDDQEVVLTVTALDDEGNPAAATTAWSSDDASIASVSDNGDGTALVTASPGAAGLGTTTIHAVVTDNSDGDTHEGTFEVEVVAGDAVIVNITASEPTTKAEDVPAPEPTPEPAPADTGDTGSTDTGSSTETADTGSTSDTGSTADTGATDVASTDAGGTAGPVDPAND